MHELEGLFEGPVVVRSSAIDVTALASLHPDEALLVEGAVEKRRREFATGRKLARAALAQLGVDGVAILQDEMRAPVWPEGIAGTISHCSKKAFAVVGRRDEIGTIGIDAEDRLHLSEELWSSILVDEERAFVAGAPFGEREELAMIVFSAKESLYKAQYPCTKEFMDFVDARIEITKLERGPRLHGSFRAVFLRDVSGFVAGTEVPGRFRQLVDDGILVTSVQIPQGQHRASRLMR